MQEGRKAEDAMHARLHNRLYDPSRHALPVHVTAQQKDVRINCYSMSANLKIAQFNISNDSRYEAIDMMTLTMLQCFLNAFRDRFVC